MSHFTTEVRYIAETLAGKTESEGFNGINAIITTALSNGLMPDYPIFDESYRNVLNSKIIRHYYTREIGEETFGLWKLRIQQKMYDIMPYYNKLYNSELLTFNPLYDVDLTTTHKKDNTGNINNEAKSNVNSEYNENFNGVSNNENKSNTNTENEQNNIQGNSNLGINKNVNKYSDTPQGAITGLENGTYLTNATIDESENKTDTENISHINEMGENETINSGTRNDINNTDRNENRETIETRTQSIVDMEEYEQKVIGSNGNLSYSKKLEEFRKTFLNIDLMIIEDLKHCFFGLWA